MSSITSKVPGWALLVTYLVILTVLAVFGDLFTFICGFLIISLVFANRYNKEHEEHH